MVAPITAASRTLVSVDEGVVTRVESDTDESDMDVAEIDVSDAVVTAVWSLAGVDGKALAILNTSMLATAVSIPISVILRYKVSLLLFLKQDSHRPGLRSIIRGLIERHFLRVLQNHDGGFGGTYCLENDVGKLSLSPPFDWINDALRK